MVTRRVIAVLCFNVTTRFAPKHRRRSQVMTWPAAHAQKKGREAEGFSGLAAHQSFVEWCQFGSIHYDFNSACAAAKRAIGTRNGLHET